ncbi:hypothetical protein [Bradyrhizobium sp. RT3b]|uniref:hypothetical protein n=1 Tax=Bradyrhizobium sp. RT3b TaxID=3156334 RepID=UPI003399B9F5
MVESLVGLQRSVAPGDRNNEARFWLARQLCLCGKETLAKPLFDNLKKLSVPFRQKQGVRGVVLSATGKPADYYGQIYTLKPGFGFLRGDLDQLETFFSADRCADKFEDLEGGQRVQYNLGFTLRGPVALALRSTEVG